MNDKKTEIGSFKHQDKRVNIPPQELSAFMEDDERSPKTTLYPRDPSLAPQLVWKGRDEQDLVDLAVPSVPKASPSPHLLQARLPLKSSMTMVMRS